MAEDPFPRRADSGEEPASSSPPASGENGNGTGSGTPGGTPGGAGSGADGTAGPGPGRPAPAGGPAAAGAAGAAGFADGGAADVLAPGPGLAGLLAAAVGADGASLGTLTDEEMLGVVAASRRIAAWAAWAEHKALAEFGARRADRGEPSGVARGAADEVGWKTRMTWQAAGTRMARAARVTERLPRTLAVLRDGRIDPGYVTVIDDLTQILTGADVAEADRLLAAAAPGKTYGQLRAAAARLVNRLDPGAVRRRKEQLRQRDAHVRISREDSGNAALSGRELDVTEALASWQHIQQRALDLRAAGIDGSLRELRVLATMDLLQERDSRATLTPAEGTASQHSHTDPDGAGPDSTPDQDSQASQASQDGQDGDSLPDASGPGDGGWPDDDGGPWDDSGPGDGGPGDGGPGDGGPGDGGQMTAARPGRAGRRAARARPGPARAGRARAPGPARDGAVPVVAAGRGWPRCRSS